MAVAKPATSAVATIAPSQDDITAILRSLGGVETPTTEFHRIKVDGSTFYLDDEPFVSNPKTGAPAFTARIVGAPEEYQALWFDAEIADIAGRPNKTGFCKSWFGQPSQAREFAEDGTSCRSCPFNPFTKEPPLGKKCQWKGELQLQIVDPATGQLRDDTIWHLTLSTTAMIEWKGTSRDSVKGNVSDQNFMHKLATYAVGTAPDADPKSAIYNALTALSLGGVVAEFRILRGQSQDGARTWSVVSATPVAILDVSEAPALPETAGASDGDAIPF